MKPIDLGLVREYVNENIVSFHENRIRLVSEITFRKLVQKNPYLFRVKSLGKASDLVNDAMEALGSSSEEKQFGDFLEELAIYIAEETSGGHKSGTRS